MALAPSRLQDFRLDANIGSGATSRVFEAEHIATGQKVAIKMLEPAASASSENRERLAREAVLLAQVQSPYVSTILGFGYEKDRPFLVLERLIGETLDAFLKREKNVPFDLLTAWTEEILLGLRDIHDAGIIHRDIKPSNLYLSRLPGASTPATLKLIDFGVARLRDASLVKDPLTSTNHVIGSLGYMAPEQFKSAREVTTAADLYAVGVVIFRMIAGRLPFVDKSLGVVLRMKSEQEAPRLSWMPNVQVHPLMEELVQRALERDPAARFQTAREMLEAWWRATGAEGGEIAPAPLTIEGADLIFEEDDESASQRKTLVGTPLSVTKVVAATEWTPEPEGAVEEPNPASVTMQIGEALQKELLAQSQLPPPLEPTTTEIPKPR